MSQIEINKEDEVDFRYLVIMLFKYKFFIITFVVLTTFFSIVYVNMKNPVPVYNGQAMIEVGEVKNNNINQTYLDRVYSLKNILKNIFNITCSVPRNTENVIVINAKGTQKDEIKQELETVINYIMERHKEKVKFYDKYIMSRQIGEIRISDKPINTPKKKL